MVAPTVFNKFMGFQMPEPMSSFSFGGRNVHYYRPPSAVSDIGLLVVLHGGLGTALGIAEKLNIYETAMALGFAVAFLSGTPSPTYGVGFNVWNEGGDANTSVVNDLGYIESFLTWARANIPQLNTNKVSLLGHSNGAMMAYNMVCNATVTKIVNSVISISGALACVPSNKVTGVNIWHFHGTADTVVPIAGGTIPSIGTIPPLATTQSTLASNGAIIKSFTLLDGEVHTLETLLDNIDLRATLEQAFII